ncbi:hypothetical protein LFM09_17135 [Lentzea alba]|uniref:hypothetical protein n=1 Tax=Lentzea alba TaxID=2714351 RepID=UPI0039BF58FC
MRYFVLPADDPDPKCPLAVVRVEGGSEQAFTRELRWEPSTRLRRGAFKVDSEWAEGFMIDMIVQMRRIRYGGDDPSVRADSEGVWGLRRTRPRIELGDGEAVLVDHGPPSRWFRSEDGVLKVGEDGTGQRFTADLRWEPSEVPASAEEVPEHAAMWTIADLVESTRERWRRHWPGPSYFAIFWHARHVLDLSAALAVVRPIHGHDDGVAESFSLGSDWGRSDTLRDFAMGNHHGVKIPIAESEAEHLVDVIRERREMRRRAYGN